MNPTTSLIFEKHIKRDIETDSYSGEFAFAYVSATIVNGQFILSVQVFSDNEYFSTYKKEVEIEIREFIDNVKAYQPNDDMSFMALL
jgi:hypothetical protein